MKRLAYLTIIAAAALTSAFAGQDYKSFKDVDVDVETSKFRDVEFQLDVFYAQMFAAADRGNAINTGPGGGFATNLFFARYFGVGVENLWYSNDSRGDYFLTGKAIVRYPIDSLSLAPYAFVGGGGGFGLSNVGFGTVGFGAEYRVTDNIGTFVEGRWLFGAPNDAGLLTTGLRFSF